MKKVFAFLAISIVLINVQTAQARYSNLTEVIAATQTYNKDSAAFSVGASLQDAANLLAEYKSQTFANRFDLNRMWYADQIRWNLSVAYPRSLFHEIGTPSAIPADLFDAIVYEYNKLVKAAHASGVLSDMALRQDLYPDVVRVPELVMDFGFGFSGVEVCEFAVTTRESDAPEFSDDVYDPRTGNRLGGPRRLPPAQ